MNGWQMLFYKEILRFWKVGFQTVAAPVITAILYMMIFGHVLEGRVPKNHHVQNRRTSPARRHALETHFPNRRISL